MEFVQSAVPKARHTKHLAHEWWWRKRLGLASQAVRAFDQIRPYRYDPARYEGTFLSNDSPHGGFPSEAPNILWTIWFGPDAMGPVRRRSLDQIRDINSGMDVQLITDQNLRDFVAPGHTLHPIFPYLSCVHRSDFFRCYLMHHYGGAYVDIKLQRGSMQDAVSLLNADANSWMVSGPLAGLPARAPGPQTVIERDVRRHYPHVPCSAAFALRAQSPLTREWYDELHRRCEQYLSGSRQAPGNRWGRTVTDAADGYPVPWSALQAGILEPLALKHTAHIVLEDRFRPVLDGHRDPSEDV